MRSRITKPEKTARPLRRPDRGPALTASVGGKPTSEATPLRASAERQRSRQFSFEGGMLYVKLPARYDLDTLSIELEDETVILDVLVLRPIGRIDRTADGRLALIDLG